MPFQCYLSLFRLLVDEIFDWAYDGVVTCLQLIAWHDLTHLSLSIQNNRTLSEEKIKEKIKEFQNRLDRIFQHFMVSFLILLLKLDLLVTSGDCSDKPG